MYSQKKIPEELRIEAIAIHYSKQADIEFFIYKYLISRESYWKKRTLRIAHWRKLLQLD